MICLQRKAIVLFIGVLFNLTASGGQFLGGELSYRFIGPSGNDFIYELSFKLYRECYTLAELDDPVISYINTTDIARNTHTLFYRELTLTNPVITNLPYSSKSFCAINGPNDCFEMRTYISQITLPYSPEGYTFYFSNCCRNGLSNLQNDAGNFGTEVISNVLVPGQALTYMARIPSHDSVLQNSSPFSSVDSVIYACVGKTMQYRFGFIDPDGDSLVYKLVPSLAKVSAATTNFYPILFKPGYNADQPVAGNPPVRLELSSGFLMGVPDRVGSFAIGLEIEEFRNGKRINISRKDYQVNVKDCDIKKPADIINCIDSNAFFSNPNNSSNIFMWNFGVPSIASDISVDFAPHYQYPETGSFNVTLIVINPEGCSDTVLSTAKIYPGLRTDFSWIGEQCKGMPLAFNDRSTTPYGSINGWSWKVLNDGRIISTSSSFSYIPVVSGTLPYPLALQLTVTSSLGCKDSLLKDILIYDNVKASAGEDKILAFGQPYQLQGGPASPGISYSWSPLDGLDNPLIPNPIMTANRAITYTLTVGNSYGCTTTDKVSFKYMKGPGVYVANAFTPNNDGVNDFLHFYPVGLNKVRFSIYNRWGQVVFSTNDINSGWNGKVKGVVQDSGAYVWVIHAVDFLNNPVTEKGSFVIIK